MAMGVELRELEERQLKDAGSLSIPCGDLTLCHVVVCSQVSTNPVQPSGRFVRLICGSCSEDSYNRGNLGQ